MTNVPCAAQNDSLSSVQLGWALDAAVGHVVKTDAYERMWLHGNQAQSYGIECRFVQPHSDVFAADYGFPTLGIGLRYGHYRGVTMHKAASPDWGQAQMVDYQSRMGDIVTAYAFFERPLYRSKHWEADYRIDIGLGWGANPYNKHTNIDNELIGSRLLIYFGAGAHATYYPLPDYGLRVGLEFAHHSNGALNRPNKGVNLLSPMVGIVHQPRNTSKPCTNTPANAASSLSSLKHKPVYATLSIGVGGKTLLEDWLQTQYATSPDNPQYRKESFHVYYSLSAQADVMYRYARRWSSGVGLDLFYSSAAKHIRAIDESYGRTLHHSPWSVGLAAKHEVWWHDLALTMSLGCYLYRHMGYSAKTEEKPYYERIGLKYVFPRLHGLSIGANVKAHLTKADQTEFVVGFRL